VPVKINTPSNLKKAKAELDALGDRLEAVGFKLPVEISPEEQAFNVERQQAADDFNARQAQNAQNRLDREKETERQIQEFAINAAEQTNQQIADIQEARVNRELQTQLSALDAEYQAKIDAAQGNTVIIANLEKQLQAAKVEAEREAARKRRDIALKEATIQYFLNLVKAALNPAALAEATVVYFLSLAAIKAQTFHKGGRVKDLEQQAGRVRDANVPPQAGGDNKLALLKTGERVLTMRDQERLERQAGPDIWRRIGATDPAPVLPARPVDLAGMSVPAFTTHRGGAWGNGGQIKATADVPPELMAMMGKIIGNIIAPALADAAATGYERGARAAVREEKLRNKINGK
jgi:hypothetical protein